MQGSYRQCDACMSPCQSYIDEHFGPALLLHYVTRLRKQKRSCAASAGKKNAKDLRLIKLDGLDG